VFRGPLLIVYRRHPALRLVENADEFLPSHPTFVLIPFLSPFQTESETHTMLNGFGTVVNALGLRAKAYLPQISGTVKVSTVLKQKCY